MSYESIEWTTDGPIAVIKLNRPERMNAVIEGMYLEIQDVLERTRSDAAIRCVILTGSVLERSDVKKQAFCAGADLKKHSTGDRTQAQQEAYIRLAHDTIRKIVELPKPIIAAVNGPARGAGIEMALACDLILMADDATLALPETGLGTFVGGGVTQILPRLVGMARAKELVFTGRIIDGKKAVELGLALRSHPVARLFEEARALASALAEKAPLSMDYAKKYLRLSPGLEFGEVLELETKAILSCMETEDWHEGLAAFSEKRKPRFKGR
jgi:enoyl-CoA hydratase